MTFLTLQKSMEGSNGGCWRKCIQATAELTETANGEYSKTVTGNVGSRAAELARTLNADQ